MILQAGERLIKSDAAGYIKGKLGMVNGVLTVTDRRLVFDQNHPLVAALGLLGVLVLGRILPRKDIVDLPLSQVVSFSRGKLGINRNILSIQAIDGREYRFSVPFDKWAPAVVRAGVAQAQPETLA